MLHRANMNGMTSANGTTESANEALHELGKDIQMAAIQGAIIQIKHQCARLASLYDTAGVALLTVTATGEVRELNQEAAQLFGRTQDEFLTAAIMDCVETDQRETLLNHLRQTLSLNAPQTFEMRIRSTNGQIQNAIFQTRPDPQQLPDSICITIRSGQSMRQSELDDRQVRQQAERLRKLESLQMFASGMAHDFNNLLMGITGNLFLVMDEVPAAAPWRAHLEEIGNLSKRAIELCRQILAYAGRTPLVFQRININTLLRDMMNLLQISACGKATIRFMLAEDLPDIEADAARVRQALVNLVTNAADATDNTNGVITITTSLKSIDKTCQPGVYINEKLPEGYYVCISVADNGCGISNKHIERVFDPFFSTKATGRGLGLPTVLGIMHSHRGTITISSTPGQGSDFALYFPTYLEVPKTRNTALQNQDPQPTEKRTILVIDDEEAVRRVTTRMLQKFGFDVIPAADGPEAIEIFQEKAAGIDIIILDLTMPHMSGEETLAHLKKIRSDTPVILASGYSRSDATSMLQEHQAPAAFIEKPFQAADLVRLVNTILQEEEQAIAARHQT